MKHLKRALCVLGVVFLAACGGGTEPAPPAAAPRPMAASPQPLSFTSARGIHAWSSFTADGQRAMREAAGTALHRGGQAGAQVSVDISYAPFQNGATVVRNDLARVRLANVTLSDGTRLADAGFWVGRDRDSGDMFLQFRPSVDANLSGVTGFAGDFFVFLPAGGSVGMPPLSMLSGPALQLVADVLASGAALMRTGTASVQPDATLGQAQAAEVLAQIASSILGSRDAYFDRLRTLNVEWLGISVSMFMESVGDPTVRLKYRAEGDTTHHVATWGDADLRAFMLRARTLGFKVYLTLAFEHETGDGTITDADARCNTPQAPVPRWIMGKPTQPAFDAMMRCLAPQHYWWAPSHPEHAARRAQFWQSYQAVAVKYAQMAQETGVGLYSLGTETEWLFRTRAGGGAVDHFAPELQQMVAAVRQHYSGLVTYDQHIKAHSQPMALDGGEWGPHLAADLGLDVIGLSAYIDSWPTVPTSVLPVAQLEQAFWQPVFQNVLLPLQAANPGRPIVFTEFGVVNDLGAPYQQNLNEHTFVTGRDAEGVTDGMRQQAAIYTALFNVNERLGRPLAGIFFWSRPVLPGAAGVCDLVTHDPACSPPAAQAIAQGFRNWALAEAQRVFDWAQHQYGHFFPGTPQAGELLGYTYRFYPGTGNYLGYKDGGIYVHNGRDWNIVHVGPAGDFLGSAAAAGF